MSEIIKIIKKDIKNKQDKYIARKYYYYESKQDFFGELNIYENGKIKTKTLDQKSNLYTNYFRTLVNQKIDYLLAKETTTKIKNENIEINEILEDSLLNASLDSTSWLHFFIRDGELDYCIIKDCEIIPFYDEYNKNIIKLIRYYNIAKDMYKVEIWDNAGVAIEIYKIEDNKEILAGNDKESHYYEVTKFNNEIEETKEKNFKTIPFIPLFNNKMLESDLVGIKELIDMYNSISSGFIDNIYKFQEMLMLIKSMGGDELGEIAENFKKYKIAQLPENADIKYISVEIPTEARTIILKTLKDNIFLLGRGVDPSIVGDGNITNIVIKSRYALLDMKANEAEKQLKKYYRSIVKFINDYYSSDIDNNIVFNRTMIFNTSESIQDCVSSISLLDKGLISMETIMKNNPWISDIDKEKKLIENENKEIEEENSKTDDLEDQTEKEDNKIDD